MLEGTPPAWLPRVLDRIGAVYGRQSLGEAPVALVAERAGEGPYGGNMGFRRGALLASGGFNPSLGVRHGEYALGEETEVIRKMLEAGHTGWWTPEARVRHRVPEGAQTLAHVRRWMVGAGRYRARPIPPSHLPRLCGRLLRHELAFQLRRRFAPPERWINDLRLASQLRGRILAARSANRSELSHGS